jgi:hypothetical protein
MGYTFFVMLLSPLGANASAYGLQGERWKAMNLCSKQAQKAHPDLTAESNAKREGSLQECSAEEIYHRARRWLLHHPLRT